MMKRTLITFLGFSILLVLVFTSINAKAAEIDKEGSLKVTFIIGKVWLKRSVDKDWIDCKMGLVLRSGDRIKTEKGSRVELTLDDGSVMRLGEKTEMEIENLLREEKGPKKSLFDLLVGKSWSKVKRLFHKESSFTIKTPVAVAGIRGTTYRVDVERERAQIRVYKGSVRVTNPPRRPKLGKAQEMQKGVFEIAKPVQEVEKPFREVTMKEWCYIVKEMMCLTITHDEKVTMEPFKDDPKDEWVRWNKERDASLKWEEENQD
jgi:hypothetical protein